ITYGLENVPSYNKPNSNGRKERRMKKPTLKQRLQYQFDNYMSRGTIALIGGLALISLALIFLAAAVIRIGHIAMGEGDEVSFGEAAWMSLMRTLDAGTMGGDEGFGFRFI